MIKVADFLAAIVAVGVVTYFAAHINPVLSVIVMLGGIALIHEVWRRP